jgi:hypothetical protein
MTVWGKNALVGYKLLLCFSYMLMLNGVIIPY